VYISRVTGRLQALAWAPLVCLAIIPHTAHAAERVLFFSPIMGKPSQQAKYTAVGRHAPP
jgi:hypothetical protein